MLDQSHKPLCPKHLGKHTGRLNREQRQHKGNSEYKEVVTSTKTQPDCYLYEREQQVQLASCRSHHTSPAIERTLQTNEFTLIAAHYAIIPDDSI